jgi:hypothetical protein
LTPTILIAQRTPAFLEPESYFRRRHSADAGFGQQFVPSVCGGDFDETLGALGDSPAAKRCVSAMKKCLNSTARKGATQDSLSLFRAESPHVIFFNIEYSGNLTITESNGAQDRNVVPQLRKKPPTVVSLSVG